MPTLNDALFAILPCKIGDKIYVGWGTDLSEIFEAKVTGVFTRGGEFHVSFTWWDHPSDVPLAAFGKHWWADEVEAMTAKLAYLRPRNET